MKNYFLLLWLLLLTSLLFSANDTLRVELDLNSSQNHTIHATIFPPSNHLAVTRFVLPEYIPGLFQPSNAGKLISSIEAVSVSQNQLKVLPKSTNEWEVISGDSLYSFSYLVHDSWQEENTKNGLPQQFGTNFEADKQVLLNFGALLFYVDGWEKMPIQIVLYHAKNLRLFCALPSIQKDSVTDIILAENYLQLLDNPAMYCRSDNYFFRVGSTTFHVGLYSESGTVDYDEVLKTLKPVCQAVAKFCSGFSVSDYTFLLCFVDGSLIQNKDAEVFGAAQHSASGVFFFAENDNKFKRQQVLQYTAAHELLHLYPALRIQTDATSKLRLQSRQQTRNLWLYEGVTEYFSLLMQWQQDLISQQEFINEMRSKMALMKGFEPFNLEKESEKIQLPGHQNGYKNFYYKGAVAAMMLDLDLLKASKGQTGLKGLLLALQNNSTPHYVVKDEHLLDELKKLAPEGAADFFSKHLADNETIDYSQYLQPLGWQYKATESTKEKLYANLSYHFDKEKNEITITHVSMDQVGFQTGDVLYKINRKKVNPANIELLLGAISSVESRSRAVFTVKRGNEKIKLTGVPLTIQKDQQNEVKPIAKPSSTESFYRRVYKNGQSNQSK